MLCWAQLCQAHKLWCQAKLCWAPQLCCWVEQVQSQMEPLLAVQQVQGQVQVLRALLWRCLAQLRVTPDVCWVELWWTPQRWCLALLK